jgi:hypothetical protein
MYVRLDWRPLRSSYGTVRTVRTIQYITRALPRSIKDRTYPDPGPRLGRIHTVECLEAFKGPVRPFRATRAQDREILFTGIPETPNARLCPRLSSFEWIHHVCWGVRLVLMPFPILDTLAFKPHGPTLVRNGMREEFLKQTYVWAVHKHFWSCNITGHWLNRDKDLGWTSVNVRETFYSPARSFSSARDEK